MKKKSLKVLLFFFILIIASQHTVFADVIMMETPSKVDDLSPVVFISIAIFLSLLLFFIVRLHNKKVSNTIGILLIITIIIICSVPAYNYITDVLSERFNSIILEHINDSKDEVNDVEKLVKTIIDNNKNSKKKISLVYLNKDYRNLDELNDLLKEIDTTINYYAYIEKDGKYISKIRLSKDYRSIDSIERFHNATFISYGGIQNGSQVKYLIRRIINNAMTYEEETYYIPSVSYNSSYNESKSSEYASYQESTSLNEWDRNKELASRILIENANGEIVDVKVGGHSPVGINRDKLISDYISFLDELSKGLDLKHSYNVIFTKDDIGKISGITINYDKNSNIENFEPSYDEKAVNGVVSTTGMDIYCEAE